MRPFGFALETPGNRFFEGSLETRTRHAESSELSRFHRLAHRFFSRGSHVTNVVRRIFFTVASTTLRGGFASNSAGVAHWLERPRENRMPVNDPTARIHS